MKKRMQKAGALLLAFGMMVGMMSPTAYASPYWSKEEDGIVTQHVVLDSEKVPVEIGAEPGLLDVSELEGGSMVAQKFGAFANEDDASKGIVKLTLDVAGKPVEAETIMDLVIIADESGSLNMYGRGEQGERKENKSSGPLNIRDSASYMPCLNEDHAYLVGDIQEELYKIALVRMEAAIAAGETVVGVESIREKLENGSVSYDVYINPHDVGMEYTVFGKWGSAGNEPLVREMLKSAKLVDGSPANVDIPEILTDDDVYLALLSDWDEVAMKNNGHLTFTTNVVVKANDEYSIPRPTGETVLKTGIRDGWDPDSAHCHFVNGRFELIPQPENTDSILYNSGTEAFYSYWSPAVDNEYGCYDRMMVENEGLVSLAVDVLNANSENRVAYVGFCRYAYKSLSSNGFFDKNDWETLEPVLSNTNGHDYTNYIDALNVAAGIIGGRTDAENRSCYVIFVSDGMPNTFAFSENGGKINSCFNIVEEGYSDTLYGLLDAAPTKAATVEAMAVGFKNFLAAAETENTKFVSVGFCTDDEASALLKSMSSNEDTFFNCTDAASFLEAMGVIQEKLPAKYPSGVLTDVIGDDFDLIVDAEHPFVMDGDVYESAAAAVESGRVTIDGANLSWDMNNVDENGVRISFYVQVDDLEKYEDLLPTNEDTEEATGANLTYHRVMVNETSDGYLVDENATNIALKTPYLLMTTGTKDENPRIINFYKTTKLQQGEETVIVGLEGIVFDIYFAGTVDQYTTFVDTYSVEHAEELAGLTEDEVAEKIQIAFAEAKAAEVEAGTLECVETVTTDPTGNAIYNVSADRQPDGIYLVIERPHPAIVKPLDPFLVAVPATSADGMSLEYVVNVTPKNEVLPGPEVEKNIGEIGVDHATFAIGQTHTWILRGGVPVDIAIGKTYELTDTMDASLTYVGNVKVVVGAADLMAGQEEIVLTKDVDYTLSEVENNIFTVALTPAGMIKVDAAMKANTVDANADDAVDYKDMEIRVYFNAKINENALVGTMIPNEVDLYYKNSVGLEYTPEDGAEVYTCGIHVHKYDAKDVNKALEGAVFKLAQVVDENTEGAVGLVIKNAQNKVENVSVVYREFYIDADCTMKANTITTDENGNALIYGLEAGTYYLVEIKAPNGYNLLSYPVQVTLDQTSHHTGDIETTQIVEIDRTVYVANSNTFRLPETGGIGTAVFTLVGSLMMGGAGVMLVNKKREEE